VGSYYYLIAQLPYLIYEQKPPMSSEDFKNLAASLMTKKDAALLNHLSLDPQKISCRYSFMNKWKDWENTLRIIVAKQRAAKLKREAPEVTEPLFNMDITAAALKAVDESSPLEAETMLDKARWNAIDDLAGNDYFHKNIVFAYYLKLLLIERRQVFNVDKGFDEYKSLYASIVESVQNEGDLK
jgi:hypothetical protein